VLSMAKSGLRVLHLYRTYFPDPPGGLQEAIRQISLATRARGIEPRIFTLSPTPHPIEIECAEGKVIRSRSWAAPASCDLGGLDSVRQFLALSKWADVIHYHFPWPFADVLHMLGGESKPSIMTYHSDIVRQRYLGHIYGPLMRHTMRSMSAVVATSPAYARTSPVLTRIVPKDRLRVIPLGIVDYRDSAHLADSRSDCLNRLSLDSSPFFLSLGVLRYYKGLHTLVEAALSVKAKIVISGSGPERERLESLAEMVGASNVVFAGQVTNEEKVALLQRCRALVLPSHVRSEAFGMAQVEAAMFGRPMVCCEVGSGTTYVNAHGVTGLVVPPESPERLAEAMNALLVDEALASRMGLAARERYERLLSGEALGQAYAALYLEVSAGR
jgi:glycosyltransferase involved in cell wall biosynthesis